MRMGSCHKTLVERGLLAVRAQVLIALDALPCIDAEPARGALKLAEKTLRSLELEVSKGRLGQGGPIAEVELLDLQDSQDTAKWLLGTFTEHDDVVANSNQELHASRFNAPKRRRSIFQQSEDVHGMVAQPEVAQCLEKCGTLDFDALALAEVLVDSEDGSICVFGAHVLQYGGDLVASMHRRGWVTDQAAFSQSLLAFMGRLDDLYPTGNTYHNAAHAVDVMATTDFFMRGSYVQERTTSLDHLMAIVAAAVHDVGHPGTNALFQTKTMSPLALRYNDQSILENMHASLAFQTMQESPECNWIAQLTDGDVHQATGLKQYVRKGIISMVLATDMAKHQKYVEQLKALVAEEQADDADCSIDESVKNKQVALDRKLFLLDTIVHAADLSNPSKPRSIAMSWTKRVCEEFWAQGDQERSLGLQVSPLCDRGTGVKSVPRSQLGFINFVVLPLFRPLAELVSEVSGAIEGLSQNASFWEEMEEQGATFEDLFSDASSKH
jgi:hypothetical protein